MNAARLIFLVDDDYAVRESLKFALELEGLAVRTCASGPELLGHPDLTQARCLVLDYAMPEMDGLRVLEQLAGLVDHLPVIIITGFAVEPLRERATRAGVVQILEKPLSDSQLIDSIQGVLNAA